MRDPGNYQRHRFAPDSPLEGTGFEPSVPPALVAAHIRPIIVPTPRRSSAAALADGFVPLESDWRPLPDPATSFANSRYFRPVRPKRPASTGGTRSSNPLPSTGESANLRSP